MPPRTHWDVDASEQDAAVRSGAAAPAPGGARELVLDFLKYSPSQPRDAKGRWTDSGSGASSLDVKGDFNPAGSERMTFSGDRKLSDYLTVQDVDMDTVEAVRDTFEGEWGGLRTQVHWISATEDGGNIHVVGRVLDEDDEEVGEFIRDIFPGDPTVHHQSLYLSPTVQGRGFAKGFLSQSEAHYRAQGIDAITVQASDDVGGYAWARAGFDWEGGVSPSVIQSMEHFAESYPDHHATRSVKEYLDEIRDPDVISKPSPRDISMLGEGNDDIPNEWGTIDSAKKVHAGAAILLGTEWEGVKDIRTVRKATVHLDDLTDEDWLWIERACSTRPVAKYSPNQPRHPKGSREGGRFAPASGSGSTPASNTRTGGWTTRVTDFETSLQRIQNALPKADVFVDGQTHPAVVAGIAEASARFANQYPEIAPHIHSVRVGNPTIVIHGDMGTTISTMNGDMETTISTIRKRDGSMSTGFALLVSTHAINERGFQQYVDQAGIDDTFGRHPFNSSTPRNLADWTAASMTHEFGHVVHNWSTAKGAGLPLFQHGDHPAYNPTVWNDLAPEYNQGRSVDPDNAALAEYRNHAVDNDIPPPSTYGGYNTAEAFAEAYSTRHGPAGMRGVLDPGLESIVEKIEQDAYDDVGDWNPFETAAQHDRDHVMHV